MPRALCLHHLAILVSDLERAENFYLGVLGLPLRQRHFTSAGVHRATWLDSGDGFLALELAHPGQERSECAPGLHCLALRIDASERETWRSRLVRAGHPVERESDYTLYLRDPDGVLLGLSHHPHPRAG